MKRSFGDMDLLQQSNNIEKLLRGMIRQPAEKADSNFVDDVSMIKDLLGNGQIKHSSKMFITKCLINIPMHPGCGYIVGNITWWISVMIKIECSVHFSIGLDRWIEIILCNIFGVDCSVLTINGFYQKFRTF